MLQLQPITKDNWYDAIQLKVADDQQKLVASNAVSLAQLNFLENFYAKGIFDGNTMVGFTLFGLDDDDHEFWIYRLMIDARYQSKGYGKAAIDLIVQEIEALKTPQHKVIHISYAPENVVAKRVYEKAGFVESVGTFIGGEQLAVYTFN